LAGTKSPYRTAVSQRGKQEQQLIEEYRAREPLSRRREKAIFAELEEEGLKIERGKEWHKVPNRERAKLKAILTDFAKTVTNEKGIKPRRSTRNKTNATYENTRSKKK
jgi:hypothetical protein